MKSLQGSQSILDRSSEVQIAAVINVSLVPNKYLSEHGNDCFWSNMVVNSTYSSIREY